MDPLDVPTAFEITPSTSTTEEEEEGRGGDLSSHGNFDDIFGEDFDPVASKASRGHPTTTTSLASGQDSLFSLDPGVRVDYVAAPPRVESGAVFASLQTLSREDEPSARSSLFDDLLDFSFTKPESADDELERATTASDSSRPVADVDLLLGVDHDLASSSSRSESDVKARNPDILDFIDAPSDDLPLEDSMELTTENSSSLLFEDSNIAFNGKEKSPDILVTSWDVLVEDRSEKVEDEENGEEKKTMDRLGLEDSSKQVEDSNRANTKEEDFDFSVIELSDTTLNFDLSKHKRSLSKKGSIANRKKPKRSTLLPDNEDSLFQDSTEPKPTKPAEENEINDKQQSPELGKGDNAGQDDAEPADETFTGKKIVGGGMKIPGLLESLSKTKVFAGKITTPSSPQTGSAAATATTSVAATTTSSAAVVQPLAANGDTTPSVPVRPKPVALPRVLPKPSSKILKDSQNKNTVEGMTPKPSVPESKTPLTSSSSFRDSFTTGEDAGRFGFMKESSGVARSSSLRGTTSVAAAAKELEQSAVKSESKPSPFSGPGAPPLKPLLQKAPPGPLTPKSETKTPPPVPSKPTVAAKPRRTGPAAAFHGGRSPLLPISNLNSEGKLPESALDAEKKPATGLSRPPPGPDVKLGSGSGTATPEWKPASGSSKPPGLVSASSLDAKEAAERKVPPSVSGNPVVALASGSDVKPTPGKRPSVVPESSDSQVGNSVPQKEGTLVTSESSKADSEKGSVKPSARFSIGKKSLLSVASKNSADNQPDSKVPQKESTPVASESSNADSEKGKNVGISRIPSLKKTEPPAGLLDRVKLAPGESHKSLISANPETSNVDDVLSVNANSAGKNSGGGTDSAETNVKSDGAPDKGDLNQPTPPRRVSLSGILSVKSPLTGDRPTFTPRKGSITSSAYNPMGFRSTSVDSDSKSRGNSVSSSSTEGTAPTTPSSAISAPTFMANTLKPRSSSIASSDGQRSRIGSFNSAASVERKDNSPERNNSSGCGAKPLEVKRTASPNPSGHSEEKSKEAADEANKSIRDQTRAATTTTTARERPLPGKINGAIGSDSSGSVGVAERKTSPWGVKLKKVEKQECNPEAEIAKKENSTTQPMNWRQQLSVRKKTPAPLSESEKPKQDNTPEWAKASIKRRQRLIDSGIIKAEAK